MRALRTLVRAGACVGLALISAQLPAAESGNALERFLNGLKTLRTDFTQTVTDTQGQSTESGSGTLLVRRPGEFRWDYTPRATAGASGSDVAGSTDTSPSGQLLVADGKNLWFYDRELSQVTVKPIGEALSSTPMMLLTGPVSALQGSFDISDGGAHDGLQWTAVKPRSDSSDFKSAELGFAHAELARMIVHDRLGQTVRLDFAHGERNAPLDASAFAFRPPPGVDVIGTPQG